MGWGKKVTPAPDFMWDQAAAITRLIDEGALEIRGYHSLRGLYCITGPGSHGPFIDHVAEVAIEMGVKNLGPFYLAPGSVALTGHIKRETAKALGNHFRKKHYPIHGTDK